MHVHVDSHGMSAHAVAVDHDCGYDYVDGVGGNDADAR